MRTVSVAQAKDGLPALLREVEDGRPVRITRRGRGLAVVLAEAEYERLRRAAGSADFAAWAEGWRAALPRGFEGITAEELERWRDA